MRDPIALVLGDQTWTIPPLNFGDVKKIMHAVKALNAGEKSADEATAAVAAMDAMAGVVKIAIARTDPGAVEKFDDLCFTQDDLFTATNAVLVHAGLELSGRAAPGEAQAPASTGAGSEAV